MKSKKLISLLCAAAMSASAFAGLTVTASAATDLVTLDGSTADGWVAPDGADKGDIVPTVTIDDGETDQYLKFQGSGGGNRKSTYSLGQTISGQYTIEYDTMMTRGNGMSRIMHSNQLAFTNDTNTKDTRDGAGIIDTVNAQQGTKYNSGSGASVANAAMKTDLRPYLTDKWVINDDSTSELVAYPESAVEVADTKWVRVQAAVNNDKTTVTVIDKSGNKLVDGVEYTNSTNEINSIYVCSNRGDGGSGIVALDNLHIYQGAPETLTTDGLRGDATVVVPTVMPVPDVKTQAPGLSAPDGVTPVVNNTFSKALASTAMGETATTITDVDGLSIAMGNRTGGDTATTVSVEDWAAGDKVLTLAGGPYSGAGRGPVVSAANTLALADGKSSVMTFAVNLGSNKAGGAGRLYILKDNSQAGTDKNGAYNNVMGVLTTDDTASSYTIGSGSNVITIGQQVEAYQWYKVAIIVSSDKFRIWVAKADEDFTEKPQVDCDHVGTGNTATSVTELPLLAVTSEKGGSYTGSVARIDNMLTYSGTADQPRKLLPTTQAAPTPAPIPAKVTMSVDETANTVTLTSDKDTDAVLVQASYRTDNTLDSVKKVVNLKLEANKATTVPATDLDAFTTNDKIMVWDSLKTMTPLANAYTVKNGAAQATAKPAPTAEPTEAPAETAAPTAEPTDKPAPTAVPTPAVATATLHDASNTIADADLYKAGSYSVTATAEEGSTKLAVAIEDLKEHQNGEGANGYWVGAAITAPEGTTIDKYYFSKTAYTAESTLNDTAEEDKQTIEFYVNAGNENKVTYAAVKLSDGNTYVYAIDTTNVKKYVVKSAVTMGTVTGGTATVTGATELKSVAEGTELTVVANTPALGYLAANPTITVTKTDDAETAVAVTEGKFTMPAYPVTVKVAYAADPTVAIATLENTATSGWGSNSGTSVNTETGLEHFNNDTDTSWAGTAFAQFTLPTLAEGEGVAKAELIYNVKQGGNRSRTSKIFALTNGEFDLTTLTGAAADRFADARTLITSFDTAVGENALTTDVTAAAQGKSGKITLMFTDNAGGADLYGKASADKAPVLKITKGKVVTFNVTAAANADTKVAGAKIVVKNGDTTVATITTDDQGVASTALSAGTYTYTVESNDYAIKTDGEFTVADSVVAENVALTANAAKTVEIANPATGTTLAQGEEATYTATVKDQDGRVMTAAVDWAVVNSEDVAAESITVANGKVNVAEEATAGDYKVKATVNGTTVSATADLKVIAAEKLNLSITSQNADQGTVAYTVNGVASTDTQLNKGKKIVATATPAALYEFAGWATSTENATAGTYVSTDAQYSFDLNANTTLIAVFKYNGIYYQNDYNNATESDWVSGNTGRYTVSIAGDDDKYTQISAVKTGENGTSITSSAVQVDADKDYIAEFDLALTGGTNQLSGFAVKAKDSDKYALVLQLKTANTTTWTVNGTTDVTLEKGVLYHYTIEKVETGVKVTIAPKAGGDAVVDGVTYANDTATTGEFAGKVSNAGLAGMKFNTKRYYAGMKIDNVLVKAPAATSVTE